MKDFHIALAAVTSVILFIFGLENFSKEVQRVTGEKFRKFLAVATKKPLVSFFIGAIVTGFIQSSSATSIITISLVNAGVLSFKNSIGVIIGSNVGTTVTSQLVAFKLTSIAPVFIILGFFLSFIKSKYAVFAKSLFYFGFVFFTLNLISSTLSPLQNDERLVTFLTTAQNPFLGVLIGALITAIIQSSSVTTGIAIIFTQQGIMGLENAIPILMGANIGTTATALLSIFNMDIAAKKTALAHFLFNIGGVLLFFPLLFYFKNKLPLMSDDPAIALANFHFLFNISTAMIFLFLLKPFTRVIDQILGEGKMDFERFDLSLSEKDRDYPLLKNKLEKNLDYAFAFLQESYNLVTLSIETNYKGIYETTQKRIEYFEYFRQEVMNNFSIFVGNCSDKNEISKMLKIVNRYEYVFQLHDSIKDINKIKESLDSSYIELQSDILLIVREMASGLLHLFDLFNKVIHQTEQLSFLQEKVNNYQKELDEFYRELLILMTKPDRKDAASIFHLVTYNQRIIDKLLRFQRLSLNEDHPQGDCHGSN